MGRKAFFCKVNAAALIRKVDEFNYDKDSELAVFFFSM